MAAQHSMDAGVSSASLSRRTEYLLLAAIIVVGILVRLPLMDKPLIYSGNWRGTDTASIARSYAFNEGVRYNLFYPQINWRGNGPGYVETEFQLYTFLVALLYGVVGEQVWLGRLVSLLFAIPTFLLFYALARRLTAPGAALWALAFFVFMPIMIRYSVAFMPEATVLFFYVAALYCFQRWLDEGRTAVLLLAGVCTALAILVKPTAIHIGLIFLLLLVARHRLSFLKMWQIWVFAAICLLPGVVWYLHARNLYLTYGNTFGVFSGGDSKFGNFSYWLNPSFYRNLIALETRWIFAVGGLLFFAIGFILALRRRHPLLLIFGTITTPIYYMIVARYAQEEWGIQYHIYFAPFAALGTGIGLSWIVLKLRQVGWPDLRRSPYALAGVAGGAALLAALIWTVYMGQSSLYRPSGPNMLTCGTRVNALVPEGSLIIVSTTSESIQDGVPNNYQEPDIFFYSDRYGWSLPSDWHTPERVEAYRQEGASFLVIPDPTLYEDNPALASYLLENARQIGPGPEEGCGIYQFSPS